MADYEIRIIKSSGARSLVYACQHLSDQAALLSAQKISRDVDDRIEVWQGIRCAHSDLGLAKTG